MANTNELTTPVKKGRSNFNIVGEVVLNDFSFKKDVISDNSGYKYSSMNLGIKTKDNLITFVEAMGGYFPNNKDNKGNYRANRIYVNAKDDFTDNFDIDFIDRFDETVLDTLHVTNFLNVGIEKTEDGEGIVRKRFLSEYDLIDYLEQHLESGMVVSVSGNIEYSVYNDEVQARKKIKSIYLSKKEKEDYSATFTQTILLNRDSIDKKVENDEVTIYAQVPEYISKINGQPVKKTLALPQTYTVKVTDATKKMMAKFMKAKKGYITEITMEGEFLSSVVTGEVNEDELSPDMLELVEMGLFSMEEALDKQNSIIKGDRGVEVKMLRKPHVKQGQEENAGVVINYCIDKYKEEELLTHYMFTQQEEDDNDVFHDTPQDLEEGDVVLDEEDSSWLDEL